MGTFAGFNSGGPVSVISPAKLQNAATTIDRIGEEGEVIRTVFVITFVITAVCAVMTQIWVLQLPRQL